jgi:hypothetical protein
MIMFGSFLEEPRSARHPSANGGWGIADAVIVGTVGYAASVLFLLLSMFGAYSIPSVYSRLQFYRLDSGVYVLAGLVGGIAFGGPLVVWYVHMMCPRLLYHFRC